MLHRYLEEKVSAALRRQRGEYLAKEFRRRWDDHKVFTEWMRKMFLYLDKQLAQCVPTCHTCRRFVHCNLRTQCHRNRVPYRVRVRAGTGASSADRALRSCRFTSSATRCSTTTRWRS